MPLRLTNLELLVEEPEAELRARISARLGLGSDEPITWRILRKSLDARSRNSLRFVYTVVISWPGEGEWLVKNAGRAGVERFESAQFEESQQGSLTLTE